MNAEDKMKSVEKRLLLEKTFPFFRMYSNLIIMKVYR